MFLKVNSDTELGKELRKKFSVRGLPTTILLTPEGAEVDRILGYGDRNEYLRTLLGYIYGVDTLADMEARSQADPEPQILADIAEKYLGRGSAKEGLAWVVKAQGAEGEKPAELIRRLSLLEGQAQLETDPPKGEAALKKLVLDSPAEDPIGEEAFSDLSRYYRRVKKDDKALVALLDAMMPRRGDDPQFLNEYAWTCAEMGVNLDKALDAAKKAVEKSEEDPGILDTLAEVYFKKGDAKSAVATIEKALAKKPDDDYFQKQKEKFLGAGKAKAKG